ncbi:Rv3235 family protein [Gordonia westfalica]|uniref:Rv3235 family protein n=1 Tax=Gordonia westfalica TaxID=158898 RepID=A0ABU2GTB5_9ACTN|nr:Rv3235 family protein [Gordonia westfalica]MDS1113984.1 Rv3235 family protein [Gordonia westfalica]
MQTLISAPPAGVQTTRVRVRPAPTYEPAGTGAVGAGPAGAGTVRVRTVFPRPRPGAGPSRKTVAAAAEARRFTIATSRLLFEVIDRRRGIAHLGDSVSPAIADQVAALVRHDAFRVAETAGAPGVTPVRGTLLHRVHVQLCDISAAEVFGSFTSGGRIRAFAGRVERKPCRVRGADPRAGVRTGLGQVEYRWQLVALEFG